VADPITDRRHSTTTDLQPQSHGKASGDAGHGERSWPRDDMEKWDMYGFRRWGEKVADHGHRSRGFAAQQATAS